MSKENLSPTLEDYLEAIFQITTMNKVARSMEIADRLKVKRSSVTIALRSLAEKGYINYEVRSYVTLTDEGNRVARCVDRRHHILFELFTSVFGLSESEADVAACRMEHGMTSVVCKKAIAFLTAMKKNPENARKITDVIDSYAKAIDCKADCGYSPQSTNSESEEKVVNLNFLESGEQGAVVKVIGPSTLKRRLQEMGIVKGQIVTVVKAAPLDDPIEIKIKSFHLSMRRDEAANVLLTKK
jgi:DtxR family transcriptional regulator, Mn-dependent transcriptional regulator